MRDFRGLVVWQRAHDLTVELYRLTRAFPREELFGLTSQIRRSAASIGANIAEGCGRNSGADFGRYLQIAFGSACECEYHLLLARDVNLIEGHRHSILEERMTEVKRMLTALMVKVRADS
jgi:four helix bundle protein